MSERKYSVPEIDLLRRAIDNKYLWGRYSGPSQQPGSSGMSRTFREEEKAKVVEEMVRTAMLAGHTAEDLFASEIT